VKRFANTAPGQNGTMTLAATAGQAIQFQTTNQSGGTVAFRLVRPNGSTVLSSTGNRLLSTTIPETGVYTIVFDPDGTSVTAIDAKVW
jgi:plastocyanin